MGVQPGRVMIAWWIACTPNEPSIEDLDVSVSERVSTVVVATFRSAVPGVGSVRYTVDGVARSTPGGPFGTEHRSTVLGLPIGAEVEVEPVVVLADGEELVGDAVSVGLPGPDPEMPPIVVTEGAPFDGLLLITAQLLEGTWVLVIDGEGRVVWAHQAAEGLASPSAEFSVDGRSIWITQYEPVYGTGGLERLAIDGSADAVFTPVPSGHHDYAELPDGRLAWFETEVREAVIEGQTIRVQYDRLVEGPEGGPADDPERRVVYAFVDDYPPPWMVCSHMRSGNAEGGTAYEFAHSNSLVYDADEDTFYTMTRWLDGFHRIDRASGEMVWQMGGVLGEFGADLWHHGHFTDRWDGHVLVFDNANHTPGEVARVVEVAYDEGARTAWPVWTYVDPEGRPVGAIGDAKRLPGGDTVVTWGTLGEITWHAPDGTVVWRAAVEGVQAVGRVTWTPDLYTPRPN